MIPKRNLDQIKHPNDVVFRYWTNHNLGLESKNTHAFPLYSINPSEIETEGLSHEYSRIILPGKDNTYLSFLVPSDAIRYGNYRPRSSFLNHPELDDDPDPRKVVRIAVSSDGKALNSVGEETRTLSDIFKEAYEADKQLIKEERILRPKESETRFTRSENKFTIPDYCLSVSENRRTPKALKMVERAKKEPVGPDNLERHKKYVAFLEAYQDFPIVKHMRYNVSLPGKNGSLVSFAGSGMYLHPEHSRSSYNPLHYCEDNEDGSVTIDLDKFADKDGMLKISRSKDGKTVEETISKNDLAHEVMTSDKKLVAAKYSTNGSTYDERCFSEDVFKEYDAEFVREHGLDASEHTDRRVKASAIELGVSDEDTATGDLSLDESSLK